MKVLIMGGTGWVGHYIAEFLNQAGVDVTVLMRGKKKLFINDVASLKSVIADKSNEAAMKEVFKVPYTHVIDTVPTEASINNVVKYATHLKHYIHCSSTGGYTPLPFIPCDETAWYKGFRRGTGWDQKRLVDTQVQTLNQEGFPATIIRPCYITGAGMLPLDNFGDRRPDFISDVMNERELIVPDNGEALLQPIHVKDLARSFCLAMDNYRRSIGQVYNICLDHAFTLNRYLEITAAVFDKKPVIRYMPVDDIIRNYPEVSVTDLQFVACHMCFTIEKAKRDLGYKPQYSPEEAVEETVRWVVDTQYKN